jgi:hypothetical protein
LVGSQDKRRCRRGRTSGSQACDQGGTVGLFVSILVRYPEVASVTYRRETRSLRVSLLARSVLTSDCVASLRDRLDKSIRAYARLVGRDVRVFDLAVKTKSGVSVVQWWRDIDSLTQGELSLVLAVARSFLGEKLVVDHLPHIEVEELAVQEELIEEMLENLRDSRQPPNLIAFREEGRVLVYNQ